MQARGHCLIRIFSRAIPLGLGVMLCLVPGHIAAQSLPKSADDDDRQFTNVGNIALTVTNFGTLGTRNRYWPNQPSCEYPRGSQIEHLYQAGLWVGAHNRTTGLYHVSTGVTDRSGTSGEGYEYTTENGSVIFQRSTQSESRFFNEAAVSHQDFVAYYSDKNTRVPATGDSILNHIPLGISIRQESYAWNFPFADFFVVVSYTVKNDGDSFLDSVYVGVWANSVVRNTRASRPGTTGYFNGGGFGYDSLQRAMYAFEFQPISNPPANSYIAIKLLGTEPFPVGVDSLADLYRNTYFNAWGFRSGIGQREYFSPTDDYTTDRYLSRYSRMTQSIPQPFIDQLRLAPLNMTTLLSVGPFRTLAPGDSVTFALAVVCAPKFGPDLAKYDYPSQRTTLTSNMSAAQKLYDGEDLNGNNRLDIGEDVDGNNELNRYILPSPPRQPFVRAEMKNESAVIYWDRRAEETVDPVSRERDFEGYRVYRSVPGADFLSTENLILNLTLAGEFDSLGNEYFSNTGFGKIQLAEPKTFPGDTVKYWYRFPPEESGATALNGWQYVYAVSAFDKGDSSRSIPSLESARTTVRVVPGTPAAVNGEEVGVYPNPYYARAYWDGPGERTRKIYFYNLPAQCTITVYTLAGDVVAHLEHDASTSNGESIEWFRQYGDAQNPPKFAGGEHAWDIITRYDQALATGLYLFSVEDSQTGAVKTGKFAIIK